MLLKQKREERLVEVRNFDDLVNSLHSDVIGRLQYGDQLRDPQKFSKTDLVFPSGEPLPRCWMDVHYRDNELRR